MKEFDKFGNPIYSKVFQKLYVIGKNLEINGWKESLKKPNLFYKEFEGVMVFADMRGTEEVPIWSEPYPLLYASKTDAAWKKRRALRKASEELSTLEIEYRHSFYDSFDVGDEDNEEIHENLRKYGTDQLADGCCHMCYEDFDSDGLFCSEECEKAFLQLQEMREEEYKQKIKCFLCSKPLDPWSKNTIKHHISYDPEKTIMVCRSCHRKIHSNYKKYPELAPSKTLREIEREKAEKSENG